MGAWDSWIFLHENLHAHKFFGGKCQFYFYGRGDFPEAHSEGHPHIEGTFTGTLMNVGGGPSPELWRVSGRFSLLVRQSSPNFARLRQSSHEGACMPVVHPEISLIFGIFGEVLLILVFQGGTHMVGIVALEEPVCHSMVGLVVWLAVFPSPGCKMLCHCTKPGCYMSPHIQSFLPAHLEKLVGDFS